MDTRRRLALSTAKLAAAKVFMKKDHDLRYKEGTMTYVMQEIFLTYRSSGINLSTGELCDLWASTHLDEYTIQSIKKERAALLHRQTILARLIKDLSEELKEIQS